MKQKLRLICLIFLLPFTSYSQCTEEVEPKILMIGDSWAFFMHADGTFNSVLDHWGHTNQVYFSNATLAVNGAQTEDFLTELRKTEIQNQLTSKPSIDIVHISLTGNDFLGAWNVDFTPEEMMELSDETFAEFIALTDFIKSIRPGIRIVFSGYMYANFEEVIQDAAPLETSHPFYGNWESMGFPTFEQLNGLLNDFSERIYDLSLVDPQLDFINVPALMQYHFGQTSPLGVDPGGTYPALYQPLPYGDLTYPSPKITMRDYGLVRDCFHLSQEGYFVMIDYQFQKLYHKLLMDDYYVLAESVLENGSVSSDAVLSPQLKLGETAGEQFVTVLSFNTTEMADTLVEKASIFLRRAALIGGNPVGTTVSLRMKTGNLGSSSLVDADDFDDEGDIMDFACVFGVNEDDSDWLRIDLPSSFLNLISNASITQFSVRIADATGAEIKFNGVEDADFAPVLNLKYKSSFAGIEREQEKSKELIIYPNPTNENITVLCLNGEVVKIEILDLQGKCMQSVGGSTNTMTVSNLVAGQYFVRVTTENGVLVKAFVKN